MKPRRRAAGLVLTALLSLAFSWLVVSPQASAAEGCLSDVGTRVPVLFVHGLMGNPEQWGSKNNPASLLGKVEATKGTTAIAFDYQRWNLRWVTDPNIAGRLSQQISCMAASSRQQGGAGKVIVVAHSMGGLALREAIGEQPQILNDLTGAITIATPNTGSDIGEAMVRQVIIFCSVVPCGAPANTTLQVTNALPGLATGSKQLAELPDWPKSLPVYAMAGNITPVYHLPYFDPGSFQWKTMALDGSPSDTDTLVTTKSALHSVQINGLGGTSVFGCKADAPILTFVTHAACEHGALIQNATVQASVVKRIKEYVAALGAPASTGSTSHCPELPVLMRYAAKDAQEHGWTFWISPAGRQCSGFDNWSVADGRECTSDGKCIPAVIVLRWTDGRWELVTNGVQVTAQNPGCLQGPAWIRSRLSCP